MNKIVIKNNVLVGRKDFLFLYQGGQFQFDYLTQKKIPSEESISNFANNLLERKEFLTKREIDYRHIVFPSKPLLCENYIPESIGPVHSLYLGTYFPKLSTALHKYVSYPITELKSDPKYVLKTDTHYSEVAFLKVCKSIIQDIYPNEEFKDLILNVKEKDKIGDLSNMLDISTKDRQKIFTADNMTSIKRFSNSTAISGNTHDLFITLNNDSISKKRLLLFGDSFLKAMVKFFGYYFRDVVYIRSEFAHKEIIDQISPDVVITGNAERYLSNVKSEDTAENYLMKLYGDPSYLPSAKFLAVLKSQLSFSYSYASYLKIRSELLPYDNCITTKKEEKKIKSADRDSNIPEFFPSLGYFGPGEHDCLKLEVSNTISSLCLSLDSHKDVLNLKHLEIYDFSGTLITDFTDSIVTCSSSWGNKLPDKLLSNLGFHSKNEANPYWRITFKKPLQISFINVFNRADKWGSRNRNLVATFLDKDENKLYEFSNSDLNSHEYLFDFVFGLLAESKMCFDLADQSSQEIRDNVLIPELISYIERDKTSDQLLKVISNILPLWSNNNTYNDEEIRLFSLYFERVTRNRLSYPMKQYCQILNTKVSIECFIHFLNLSREKKGLDKIMLTKHGLATKGKLLKFKDKAITTLKVILKDFEEEGYKPMLSYGTLLGAYRDSSFLSFDDDIDIIMKFKSTDKDSVKEEMQLLSEKMISRGYSMGAVNENLNRHFLNNKTGIPIDVFPCWLEDNRIQLHMEKMKIRGVDPSIFDGSSNVILYEEEFPAPLEIESFLTERYGFSWNVEDKFHEWPWELKDVNE